MAILNINTDAVVAHTNRLEKMHRSALPVAIRGSLNSAAFDVKLKTMPLSAKREFTERNKTFFKANSRVAMAKGFDVKSMKAFVGFTGIRLKGGNNFSVNDLTQQEFGGTIKKRSFIPTDAARGGNKAKPVRPSNRLSKINNIVNQNRFSGNRKQRFIKAINRAGKGGYVLGGSTLGQNTLFKVNSLNKKGGFKITPLYDFKEGRNVRVKPTHFMSKASLVSGRKIEAFYVKEAKRQFERLRK
jgi:hypothetical protein